jgi:peptidyl-prolyl cis-trans isomerase SurA
MKTFFLLILLTTFGLEAKLLDKISTVINDEVITSSMIDRVLRNVAARKTISPQIYDKDNYTKAEISDLFIKRHLIRAKLTEMGYVISDDQVEGQIKSTEQRLRLNRDALLKFLADNNLSFEEYFEIIRETLEFNIFNGRVIEPLISITEQEIKNSFYKKNSKDNTITFKYQLINYSLPKNKIDPKLAASLKSTLKLYNQNGNLPAELSSLETDVIDEISEEDLSGEVKSILKSTDEGEVSSPVLIGSNYHLYFVKKKDIAQSTMFMEAKDKIYQEMFEEKAKDIKKVWFEREMNNHFVKNM